MRKIITIILAATAFCNTLNAQDKPTVPQDTVKRTGLPGTGSPKVQPKPYNSVITAQAKSLRGLFIVHKVDDKYFFEIGDSLLNKEILVVNRISKAGSEVRSAAGYAGDQIGSSVIRFEKGPNNRIFLRKVSFSTYSPDSTKSMYQAVNRSNIAAIASAFNISAFSPNSKGSVIDVTDYINSDNEIFYFTSSVAKQRFGLGSQIADRSYINHVRSFPTNIEISTTKTYNQISKGTGGFGTPVPVVPAAPSTSLGPVTLELNTSLVALPKNPMQPRFYDERVGYFTVGYTDFDVNPQGVKEIELIKRWRLEPKPQDMAKYRRGELVEPQKQIIFFIDPATPKKWVPYLIQGVNDWQKAFEKAGFKNAIIGKIAPTHAQDSTWSIDDARNSAIVYKPSEISNASGPSISDPRTGEIMESHINWFHNVQKILHDWYFIQAAAIDPEARKIQFSDDLMGQLIRFVSSHEVGHTIGLRHNFGSSSTVPVEKLRDRAFVEKNGHTPSIMDYARFNYVAQPEDKINRQGIFPRIGDYDDWAIEWGYKMLPNMKSAEAEVSVLNKLTIDKLKNPRLWFGKETNPDDPRSQSEDLGDNSMKASFYGIKNLQRILPNLITWTRESNEGYDNVKNIYRELTGQFGRYMGHVSKNIGGVYETPKTVEQSGSVYERTPASIQKEAIAFLDRQLFATPTWLIESSVIDQIGENKLTIISRLQEPVINRLVSTTTLNKLLSAEAADGKTAYKITELFSDLQNSIFKEVKNNEAIDVYRRNLQKIYVERLISLIKPNLSPMPLPFPTQPQVQSDAISIARAQLRDTDRMIKAALPNISDSMTNYHLQDISDRINSALKPGNN
ncbi:MAG TPA: zinc-dependent metalloprotease [Sphingobacteriaceae bacterium]|nr:zinc-dependent metalloprotease [Sphingobacteriaceae bacterium]